MAIIRLLPILLCCCVLQTSAATYLRGHVTDENGAGVASAHVAAFGSTILTTTTGFDGSFEFAVTSGFWIIERDSPPAGKLFGIARAQVTATDVNDLNIRTITASATLHGAIKTASGQPVAGVHVSATGGLVELWTAAQTVTDSNGNYSIGITDGTWNLNMLCNELAAKNLACPSAEFFPVAGADVTRDVLLQPANAIPQPTIESPSLVQTADGLKMRFTIRGAPSAYDIEASDTVPFGVYFLVDQAIISTNTTTVVAEVPAAHPFYRVQEH